MNSDIKKLNSKIIVIFLYLKVFLYLLSPVLSSKQSSNLLYISLISLSFLALLVNNFEIPKKFLQVLLISVSLMLINVVLVDYKYYVLVEIFTVLVYGFIPFYVVLLEKVDYEYILKFWFHIAMIISILIPLYLLLYFKSHINYGSIGHLTHMNAIIFAYSLFKFKKLKILNIFTIFLNLFIGLVFGSRITFVASVATGIVIILLMSKKNTKFYLALSLASVMSVVAILNFNNILQYLIDLTSKFGVSSRNLVLFKQQIQGASFEQIGAGRSIIYENVVEYITDRMGFPGGLAVTKKLTDGAVSYSHNIILEPVLILGIIGTIIFFIWYMYKNYKMYSIRSSVQHKYILYIIMFTSFWTRSIVGAYFVKSPFFWLTFAILLSRRPNVGNHARREPPLELNPKCWT